MTNSSVACSFNLCNGDILWSMPTVKRISEKFNTPVDFYMMPEFVNLIPLLNNQSFINSANVLSDWTMNNEYPGVPTPLPKQYDHEFNLCYQKYPDFFLADFIASQQDIQLNGNYGCLESDSADNLYDVAIGFSWHFVDTVGYKENFIDKIKALLDINNVKYIDVSRDDFLDMAYNIKSSKVFIGDCSCNHVLANILGTPVIVADAVPQRKTHQFECPANFFFLKDDSIMNNVSLLVDKIMEGLR